MKKLLIPLILFSLLAFIGDQNVDIDYGKATLFQGSWAESAEGNAVFTVKDNLIYYTEHLKKPASYKFKNDALVIYYDGLTTENVILKLNSDTLILRTEANNINLFYKRNG